MGEVDMAGFRYFRRILLASVAGAASLGAATAGAQQVTPVDSAAAESPQQEAGVEEILVTAQFRSENLQEVPISISSIGGETLANSGTVDLTGISAKVPGLYLSSYSTISPQLYIRGVGSNDDGITAEGAVGVYLDGIYVGRASAALFDLYDIDRVEVLRGPQGTLYGRNTNGGAIRIETTRAGPQTKAAAEFGVGNFSQRTARGMISGPLSDAVYGKFSAAYKKRDGWSRDEETQRRLNDEDSVSLRGQLRIEPSSDFEAMISVDFARDRPGSSFKEVVAGSLFGLYEESEDRFTGSYDLVDAYIRRDIFGLSGQFDWDIGPATLTALTGYRETDIAYTEDYDSTPFPVAHIDTVQKAEQFTQELRLVSHEGDRGFSWIVGGFFLDESGQSDDVFMLPFFGLPDEQTAARTKTRSIAVFGELGYRFSDRFKFTAGLRYSSERKRIAITRSYELPDGSMIDFIPLTRSAVSFDKFSPRAILEYTPVDDVLVYASVTRGFKSGGYNNFPGDRVAAQTAFRPETITAYEFGTKSVLLDRLVRLNVALFQYDYSDLQVFAPIDTGGQLPLVQITNAARARIRGGEVELRVAPARALTFDVNYAHLAARYREFDFGGIDLAGNSMPRSPRDTLTLAAEWSPRLDNGAEFNLRGEYVSSSNFFFSPFNDPDLSSGNFGLFNASLGLTMPDGRWRLSLFGRNLTDKTYLAHGIDGLSESFDLKTAQLAAPRQYGIALSWRY
jgi:iron complex outermembrane recepter protein